MIIKNSFYNLLGSFLPMFITLFTVPIYISEIGETKYGVLALVWLLLGYFGLFDFGLGKAVANQIAYISNREKENKTDLKEIFWTALNLNFLLGIVGGVLLFYLGPLIIFQLKVGTEGIISEVIESILIISFAVPIVTASSVGIGYLEGKEEFGILNVVQVIKDILFQIFPLATALFIDVNLYYLITSAVIAKLLITIVLFSVILFKNNLGVITFNLNKAKTLVSYGSAITVTNIIGPILSSIDRFLIGAVAGAKAVTYYTIPFNLAVKLNRITGSFSRALFPRLSMLSSSDSRKLSNKSLKILLVFITPIIIAGFLLLYPFLVIWIGENLASNSAPVGYIILLGVWINNLSVIPVTLLKGQRRPGIIAAIHSFELLPYLIIIWLLTNKFGVEGAALAWTIRVTIDAILMFLYSGMIREFWKTISSIYFIVIISFILTYFNIPHHSYILVFIIVAFTAYTIIKYKSDIIKVSSSMKKNFKNR